jgi:TRAP-type C4-dicarboxylate transport system permease small subunit
MKKVVSFLDALMKVIIILTTIVMILSCTLQVLSRFVLAHPFSWTEELARFSFIWWAFFGAAYVVRFNGHLGMDLLVKLLPYKGRWILQRAVFLISLGFCLLVTYQGIKITSVQAGQQGDLIPISMAWIYAVVPLTGSIMTIYLIYLIIYWVEQKE